MVVQVSYLNYSVHLHPRLTAPNSITATRQCPYQIYLFSMPTQLNYLSKTNLDQYMASMSKTSVTKQDFPFYQKSPLSNVENQAIQVSSLRSSFNCTSCIPFSVPHSECQYHGLLSPQDSVLTGMARHEPLARPGKSRGTNPPSSSIQPCL